MQRIIKKYPDKTALSVGAARLFIDIAQNSIKQNGRAFVALSGGSTPKLLYQALVSEFSQAVDWSKISFFWSDERTVAIDHPDSNMGMARTYLFQPLQLEKNIHYLEMDHKPQITAALYEKQIIDLVPYKTGLPQFDLILLGMGDDGHTASLFPETAALHEKKKLVAGNWVEKLDTWRITFTFSLLNHAQHIVFLVSGNTKKEKIQEILHTQKSTHPAANVLSTSGKTYWLLDEDAAQLL